MILSLFVLGSIVVRGAWDSVPVGVDCFLPLDVVFLQDTTGSFIDDLPNMVKQVPKIVEAIQTSNPGSYFGLMEFRDKPIYSLGETNDFCNKLTSKLSWKAEDLLQGYSTLLASGGADLPESQLESIIDLVENTQVGWRPISTVFSPTNATSGARVIILSTDAVPHDPGDLTWLNLMGNTYPDYPASYAGHTADEICVSNEYPSDLQMKQYLNAANTHLAILTPTDTTSCVNVNIRWHQINEDILGQPADFYQYIRGDSSDALDGVIKALANITKYVCDETTTQAPTQPPTTTMPAPTDINPTSAPTQPTPAPTQPTPAPTQPTPAPTQPTPAPTQPTPAPTQPTPAPTQPTPAPTQPTPAPTQPTPAPTQPTPAPTPAPTQPTPAPTRPTVAPPTSTYTDVTVTAAGSTQAATTSPTSLAPTDCPTACPIPCPTPCPPPCPNPCCDPCAVPPKILVKLNENPQHFALEVDN